MAKPMKAVRRPAASGALYKVTKQSYINGQLVGPGEKTDTVYYDGVPGEALEPMNAPALKAKQDAVQAEAERVELVRAKAEADLTGNPLQLKKVTAPTVRLWTANPVNKAEADRLAEQEAADREAADAQAKATAEAMKAGQKAAAQQEKDGKK